MPSDAVATGWSPTSASITSGSSRWGADRVTVANFEENSPNTRCWERCSINPKLAMSQKAVVPPLPIRIS